jgi:hypothetical protein
MKIAKRCAIAYIAIGLSIAVYSVFTGSIGVQPFSGFAVRAAILIITWPLWLLQFLFVMTTCIWSKRSCL